MIEPELGAMAKRLASMTEDRCSDHAVGVAVLQLAKMAMEAVIERQIESASTESIRDKPLWPICSARIKFDVQTESGRTLTPAERMDLESGMVAGMEWGPEDKQTFVDALADPPEPSDHLWQAADRYGRR